MIRMLLLLLAALTMTGFAAAALFLLLTRKASRLPACLQECGA